MPFVIDRAIAAVATVLSRIDSDGASKFRDKATCENFAATLRRSLGSISTRENLRVYA